MPSSTSRHDTSDTPSAPLLWLGVLGPPLVYLFDLQASYTLANRACDAGTPAWYALTTVAAALLVAGIGAIAWSQLQRTPAGDPEGGRERDYGRFLAMGGLGFSAFFLLMIVSNFVPKFILGVCD